MNTFKLLILFAVLAWPQSGLREVKYEVDGTAKYAVLTLTNEKGGKEQNRVKLPFELHFYAKPGSFLYLSAQKTHVVETTRYAVNDREEILDDGVSGTVHVLIRVGGILLQEATSSAPYGIATADGKVPD
jgi:hypothetical protein